MSEELSRQASRARKKARKANKKRKWIVILAVMLFIIGGSATAAYLKTQSFLHSIQEEAEPNKDAGVAKAETAYAAEKPLSIVLLGKDTRGEYGGGLTDVMMIMTLNPDTKKVTILSIPRDTRAVIPGETHDQKINAVYKRGELMREEAEQKGEQPEETGVSLVKKTLESIYGIPINNYVTIDFEGFRKGIDALGGVEVNVDRKLVYNDPTDGTSIHLEPGLQVLNGKQALDFVRHRHDDRGLKYYSTDYDRNDRQVAVIRSAMEKMKSFSGLTNFFKVMDAVGENVKTDLSVDQMKGLASTFGKLDGSNIVKLDNTDAYWDVKTSRTLIPQETMDKNRLALQQSMNMDPTTVTRYNDSPSGGRSRTEKTLDASDGSDKKEKSKSEKSAARTKKEQQDEGDTPKKSSAHASKKKSEEDGTKGKSSSQTKERTSSANSSSKDSKDRELLDPDKPVSESVSTDDTSSSKPTAPTPPTAPKAPDVPKSPDTTIETNK